MIYGIIIPTDFHIFQRGTVGISPTSYCINCYQYVPIHLHVRFLFWIFNRDPRGICWEKPPIQCIVVVHLDRTSWFLKEKRNTNIWLWINTYKYHFWGMNIHLPVILMFTRGTRVLTHCHITTIQVLHTWNSAVVWCTFISACPWIMRTLGFPMDICRIRDKPGARPASKKNRTPINVIMIGF